MSASCVLCLQVAILDMNEAAGQSLVETLTKEHGLDRVMFLLCNVESEEEIKGNKQAQQCVYIWRGREGLDCVGQLLY